MEKRNKIPFAFWLLCIVAAAAYGMLAFSDNMWADDAYTMAMIRHSFADILHITAMDVHPPLYYCALKLFVMPFGYSQYSARLFSGICHLLVVAIGGWQITKCFNRKMGLTYMALYMLYPFALDQTLSIRMYPLAALAIFLNALFAYRVWMWNRTSDWVGFTVAGLTAAYCHYFALVSAGIIYGLLLLCILVRKRKLLKPWLIVSLVTIALYLPWLRNLLGQIGDKAENEYWIAPITLSTLVDYVMAVFRGTDKTFALFFFAVAALLLVRVTFRHQGLPLLAVVTCVLTVLVGVVASVILRPIFAIRYLSPCAPLLVFFLAWGISEIDRDALFGGVMGFLLVGFAGSFLYSLAGIVPGSDQFRADTAALTEQAQAYLVLNEESYHVHQTAAYYNSEIPIYTPKTMGEASPFDNVHPVEDFPEGEYDSVLLFVDRDAEPDAQIPQGYEASLVGTYRDYYWYFDLWMLELQETAE